GEDQAGYRECGRCTQCQSRDSSADHHAGGMPSARGGWSGR
ncbi:MAG: hypothetical protein QOG37_2955, partial [Mycobacterium sp.]|nr:hypothetical protein [Mycobacterium sp.]